MESYWKVLRENGKLLEGFWKNGKLLEGFWKVGEGRNLIWKAEEEQSYRDAQVLLELKDGAYGIDYQWIDVVRNPATYQNASNRVAVRAVSAVCCFCDHPESSNGIIIVVSI